MPNRSNVCEPSSVDGADLAADLYLRRGAADAAHRCEVNQSCGEHDLAAALLSRLDLRSGETLIDVCCGTGQHLLRYQERVGSAGRALGFDFSEAAVTAARVRGVQAQVADAAQLPIADGAADALSCSFGIYYLANLRAALLEWRRVLKPGGRLVICGPEAGTNPELYTFHKEATRQGASDADLLALGYIERRVLPVVRELCFDEIESAVFVNPVWFPTTAAFLDYWESTSLFARTPGATRAAGQAVLEGEKAPLRITKRVTIVKARRTPAP